MLAGGAHDHRAERGGAENHAVKRDTRPDMLRSIEAWISVCARIR